MPDNPSPVKMCAIIGAGHAGTEAALHLAQAGCAVTLFSDEDTLPYYRPRLIAVAFGQADPAAIAIHPESWYTERNISLRLNTPVTDFVPGERKVNGETFDAVLIANGARPICPGLGVCPNELVQTLWNMQEAMELRKTVKPGIRLLVVGGGVLGLETAFRAAEAGCHVTIIELAPALLCGQLGTVGTENLLATLKTNQIELRTGISIETLARNGEVLTAKLSDGKVQESDIVLCSIGAVPNLSTLAQFGLKTDRGVLVDEHLQTSFPGVYAAGDIAQPPNAKPRCIARYALLQGKLAATNILGGNDVWQAPTLPLFMKTSKAQFYLDGTTLGDGITEERLDDGSVANVSKTLFKRDGKAIGVSMVGTRDGFDALCASIK